MNEIKLTKKEIEELNSMCEGARYEDRVRRRCAALLLLNDGMSKTEVTRFLSMNIVTLNNTIRTYKEQGIQSLSKYGISTGRYPPIEEEGKEWVIKVASKCPKEFGLSDEHWTYTSLYKYVMIHAEENKFPRLAKASYIWLWKLMQKVFKERGFIMY